MSKLTEILSSPVVRNSRGMMAAVVLSGVCIFGVVSMTSQVYLAYDHQQEIDAKTAEMQQTIKDLSTMADEINKSEYRPVKASQVPGIQSDLLLSMQGRQLQLVSLRAVDNSSNAKSKHKTFELQFSGPYEQSIGFLQNFHSKDALLNVLKLNMAPEGGKGTIKSTVLYRIYVK